MTENNDLRQRDVHKQTEVIMETTENGNIHNAVNTDNKVYDEDEKVTVQNKCAQLKQRCHSCCIPCLTSHNPLPSNASVLDRFKHGLMLPPHGNFASYLQFAVVCFQIWIVLYTLTDKQGLPGGNLFSLLILFICCAVGGYAISFLHLPPLLGMLIVGLLLRNVPVIKTVGEHISPAWSGSLRKIALTVILTRGGLGIDIVKLRKLSWAVLRLAWLPCLGELTTVGIVSRYLLGFPWFWSLLLGCILAALSPAVTVPILVNLQDRRYGVAKGIPTMLLAAGGLDNVFNLTGFSVFLGIIFSQGDLAVTIIKGPIGVVVGIIYGFLMGILLWFIPSKDGSNRVFFRSTILMCSGLIAIFGSSKIGLSGAGPLGCLTTATVANYKWRKERKSGETDEVSSVMALTWLIVQHFLFGLIGAAVNISNIQSSTAGLGIATLLIGLTVRSLVSFNVTLGIGFNIKERLFVTFTWLSKATVQAAVGGMALDTVRTMTNPDPNDLKYATDILTIAVLAIIICAPTGATLMAVLGPRFLKLGDEEEHEVKEVEQEVQELENGAVVKPAETIKLAEETTSFTESDVTPNDKRPIDDQKFKTELALTLQIRTSRQLENEAVLNHVDKSASNENGGIDNPAFTDSIHSADENEDDATSENVLTQAQGIMSVDDSSTDEIEEPVNIIKECSETPLKTEEEPNSAGKEIKYKTIAEIPPLK